MEPLQTNRGTESHPVLNSPGRPLAPLSVTAEERQNLQEWAQGSNARLARRAALILACLEGASNRSVAARFRVSKQAVGKWRSRFQRLRLRGLLDQPRSGAPRRIKPEDVARVIAMTLQPPPPGLPRWTTRSMARACGLSQTTVNRIWRLHGLAPHRPGDQPAPAASVETEPVSSSTPGEGAASEAEVTASEANAELLVELRRNLAGLARMLGAANPAAVRVAVDAVEAAMAAAGSATLQRRMGGPVTPEMHARTEARWRRARALFEEARAMLADVELDPLHQPPAPSAEPRVGRR